MKTTIKKSLLAILVITLLAATVFAAAPSNKPSQLVTLLSTTVGEPPCGDEAAYINTIVNPDGSSSPLVIPAGRVIVITSAEWFTLGNPNRHYRFSVSVPNGVPLVAGAGEISDSVGDVSGSVQIPSGFVMKPGVSYCTSAGNTTEFIFALARLHGYFAKDE